MILPKKISLLVLVLLFGSSLPLYAQDSLSNSTTKTDVDLSKFIYNEDLFVFADLRYGYSMIGHHFHLGGNFKYRFNNFKISFTHSDNFTAQDTQRIRMNELGFLYGWSFRKKNFLFSTSVGLSGNWGIATTNKKGLDTLAINFPPIVDAKSIGFPMEINFAFTPPPKLRVFSSIGVSFFGNFNNRKSYFGGGLNLSLGKVSPKLPPGAEKDPFREYYQPKDKKQRWED